MHMNEKKSLSRPRTAKENFLVALSWLSLGASAVCVTSLSYSMVRLYFGGSFFEIRGMVKVGVFSWAFTLLFSVFTLSQSIVLRCGYGISWKPTIHAAFFRAIYSLFLAGLAWFSLSVLTKLMAGM